MVQLIDADIKTREVLEWRGVHLFHYTTSSCSQKVRIALNLKRVAWTSHVIDITANENYSAWYTGINPRGLVPTLVHDGAVYIESNDILTYIEGVFPRPKLIVDGAEQSVVMLLRHEDELHMDLRSLSFRFVYAPPGPPKSNDVLDRYESLGNVTVRGAKDLVKARQLAYWRDLAAHGVTDETVRSSVEKFRQAFSKLEQQLVAHRYLLCDELSVVDIAWFIYVNRLGLAGYPVGRLHPRLGQWYAGLAERSEFAKEVALQPDFERRLAKIQQEQVESGRSLAQMAAL